MRISLPRHDLLGEERLSSLSEEKALESLSQWAFIAFNLHRNTGKAHQSLAGSMDQKIDNIQRTVRASSESGSGSQMVIKLWETKSFYAWTLII